MTEENYFETDNQELINKYYISKQKVKDFLFKHFKKKYAEIYYNQLCGDEK